MLLTAAAGWAAIGCSSTGSTDSATSNTTDQATSTGVTASTGAPTDTAGRPTSGVTPDATTSPDPTDPAAVTVATTTDPEAVPASPATTDPADIPTITTASTNATTSAVLPATSTSYVVPLADPAVAGWGEGHGGGYAATDLFADCGAEIVSPVNGELTEVRTVDSWDPAVDNPATRGGRSVTIVGDDGVRYYLAHLDEVDPAVTPGSRFTAGQRLGTIGLTGRTSACHVHFGISPPCPGKEWSVRRGVIPPKPYLDAWRDGRNANPLREVLEWGADNPGACAEAMADPFAADS